MKKKNLIIILATILIIGIGVLVWFLLMKDKKMICTFKSDFSNSVMIAKYNKEKIIYELEIKEKTTFLTEEEAKFRYDVLSSSADEEDNYMLDGKTVKYNYKDTAGKNDEPYKLEDFEKKLLSLGYSCKKKKF